MLLGCLQLMVSIALKQVTSCRVSHEKGWSSLWKLGVPHKVKIILWRMCRNIIPVRNLLRSQGVQNSIICPMCERDVEHLLHIFMDCPFEKEWWNIMGLNFDISTIEEAPGWLLDRLAIEKVEVKIQFATIF